MTKVWCELIDCDHNKGGWCQLDEIHLGYGDTVRNDCMNGESDATRTEGK